MVTVTEKFPLKGAICVKTALCPSEGADPNQTIRNTLLEEGWIVASAPVDAKQGMRTLTDEWGLRISGMSGQDLAGHANALDTALQHVYETSDASETHSLHRMHLLLVRQGHLFVGHFGASDIYLIRDRKVVPLAQASRLRQLEESLGLNLPSAGGSTLARSFVGAFSWPEFPVVSLSNSRYQPGDYLLFTSPGLFEQQHWTGILGSIARADTPFDQAAMRLARLGQTRLRLPADGYLLVRIAGSEDRSDVGVSPVASSEEFLTSVAETGIKGLAQQQLGGQIELSRPKEPSPLTSSAVVMVVLLLMAALVLIVFLPRFVGSSPDSVATVGQVIQPRRVVEVLEQQQTTAKAPRSSRKPAQAPAEQPVPASLTDASAVVLPEAGEAKRPALQPPTASEILVQDSAQSPVAAIALGQAMVFSGDLSAASAHFGKILSQQTGAFTIQVGVVTKHKTVRRYFDNANKTVQLMLYERQNRYYLCTGLFESQTEAWKAVDGLPEFFRKQNAVVKTVRQFLGESQ